MAGFDNEKPVEEIFAERLKLTLKLAGLTALDLSAMTGISNSTISTYIRMARTPSIWRVVEIAKALDVSVDWLCGLTEDPTLHERWMVRKDNVFV